MKPKKSPLIIRNDDVAYDTELPHFKKFCEICDKHGVKILQAITPYGVCRPIDVKMTDEEIKNIADFDFYEHEKLIEYLKSRNDLIAVHGLWHSHRPSAKDVETAAEILTNLGLPPSYFVPPFNEGDYPAQFCGLKVSAKCQRLEDYLDEGTPSDEIVYLHDWRFDGGWYTLEKLDQALTRIL